MKERRCNSGPIETRSADGVMTIVGHAAVFDQPYNLYMFDEQVARGAFGKSLKESDIAALWNHDANVVLGRMRNNTLRLEEDETGLRYEVDLPDTQAARDLYQLIERGDVYQSSFAFEVVKEEWESKERELPLRTLKEVRLYDVSPVTYPASPTTDVDIKRAIRSMVTMLRGGLPVHHTDTTTPDTPWDGSEAKTRLRNDGDAEYYSRAFAWVDPEANPDTKRAYKFIHHDVSADGSVGPANVRACLNRLTVLNGAFGGADIPDDDRLAVYRHLAAHLTDAGMEPPEFKATTSEPELEPREHSDATQKPEHDYVRHMAGMV